MSVPDSEQRPLRHGRKHPLCYPMEKLETADWAGVMRLVGFLRDAPEEAKVVYYDLKDTPELQELLLKIYSSKREA